MRSGKPAVSHLNGGVFLLECRLVGINQTESRPCKWCQGGPGKEKAIEIKTQKEPKTHTEDMGQTEQAKIKVFCSKKYSDILKRGNSKLVNHSVKETRNVEKQNCKLEQTEQIHARCSGTVILKCAECSSESLYTPVRVQKASRSQTHAVLE